MRRICSISLLLAVLPGGVAWSHGGTFVPPVLRIRQPAPMPSGSARPTPRGPAPPAMPRSPTPTSGAASTNTGPLTSWAWWWEFQREPFLEIKGHIYEEGTRTGDDGFYLGAGARRTSLASRRPVRSEVWGEVVPALVEALEQGSNDQITGSLIALARIGRDGEITQRAELERVIQPFLGASNQEVAETAAAALGILGNEGSALLLSEILLDTQAGRRVAAASSSSGVSLRTRAFAAYSLGLLGHRTENPDVRRYIVHKLARALDQDDAVTPDLGVACVIALGRVALPVAGTLADGDRDGYGDGRGLPATASREAQVLFLLEILGAKETDRIVRAHVPTSLGLLLAVPPSVASPSASQVRSPVASPVASMVSLEERVIEELLACIEARQGSTNELAVSCVMALGTIADNDEDGLDRRVRATLMDLEKHTSDRLARHTALLAAARVAARPGESPEGGGVADVRKELLSRLARSAPDTRRWSALALALLERGLAEEGHVPSFESAEILRRYLDEARSPEDVGAGAIACGLLRDREATEVLLGQLESESQDTARGYVALGLAMVEAREALEPLRAMVRRATYRPTLLREGAIALGLLGDRTVVGLLLEQLRVADSLSAQASIAQALGRIGDAQAVQPLLEMLRDEELTDRARAFAAVALGVVADGDRLPWTTILAIGTNYGAAPATLFDQAGFGILNIL